MVSTSTCPFMSRDNTSKPPPSRLLQSHWHQHLPHCCRQDLVLGVWCSPSDFAMHQAHRTQGCMCAVAYCLAPDLPNFMTVCQLVLLLCGLASCACCERLPFPSLLNARHVGRVLRAGNQNTCTPGVKSGPTKPWPDATGSAQQCVSNAADAM